MKRQLSVAMILIIAATAFGIAPIAAPAYGQSYFDQLNRENFPYRAVYDHFLFDEEAQVIRDYDSVLGGVNVTIPLELNGMEVEGIGHDAFRGKGIETIQLQENIAEIGNHAFAYNNLQSLNLHSGMTVEACAFYGNPVNTIEIGSNVILGDQLLADNNHFKEAYEKYGAGIYLLFQNDDWRRNWDESFIFDMDSGWITGYAADAPKNLVIPDSLYGKTVTGILGDAFKGLGIESIEIPNTVRNIGSYAFANNLIKSLSLPSSVRTIDTGAFSNNQISDLKLSTGISIIEDNAFSNNQIKDLYLPRVGFIADSYCFSSNPLERINIGSGVTLSSNFSQGGADSFVSAYNSGGTGTYLNNGAGLWTKEAVSEGDFTFNSGMGTITDYIGGAMDVLTVPSHIGGRDVRYIGDHAFENGGFKQVILPKGLIGIGESTFSNNQLTAIDLPTGLTTLGSSVFSGNPLETLSIGDDVSLSDTFMVGDSRLKALYEKAGKGCYKKDNLGQWQRYTEESRFTWDAVNQKITGYNSDRSSLVTIPETIGGLTVEIIGEGAFSEKGISEVIIPSGVQHIEANAFENNQLIEVTLPETLKTIGNQAFSGNHLTEVSIPSGVESLGTAAFRHNQLAEISLPNTLNTVPAYGFADNQLVEVILPEAITQIEEGAFKSNLIEAIELPSQLIEIGAGAFKDNQIMYLELPENLVTLSEDAFFDNMLMRIKDPAGVKYRVGLATWELEKKMVSASALWENEVLSIIVTFSAPLERDPERSLPLTLFTLDYLSDGGGSVTPDNIGYTAENNQVAIRFFNYPDKKVGDGLRTLHYTGADCQLLSASHIPVKQPDTLQVTVPTYYLPAPSIQEPVLSGYPITLSGAAPGGQTVEVTVGEGRYEAIPVIDNTWTLNGLVLDEGTHISVTSKNTGTGDSPAAETHVLAGLSNDTQLSELTRIKGLPLFDFGIPNEDIYDALPVLIGLPETRAYDWDLRYETTFIAADENASVKAYKVSGDVNETNFKEILLSGQAFEYTNEIIEAGDCFVVEVTAESGYKRYYVILMQVVPDTPVSEIQINEGNLSVYAGETKQLTTTILPVDASDTRVMWTTSNESVVSVDETGRIHGAFPGTAVISARTLDNSVVGTIQVDVLWPSLEYHVNEGNGTLRAFNEFREIQSGGTLMMGETYHITAMPADGHIVSYFAVNDIEKPYYDNEEMFGRISSGYTGTTDTPMTRVVASFRTIESYYTVNHFNGQLLSFDADHYPSHQVVIPGTVDGISVVSLGTGLFANKSIQGIAIPESIQGITEGTFAGNALQGIIFESDSLMIADNAFSDNRIKAAYLVGGAGYYYLGMDNEWHKREMLQLSSVNFESNGGTPVESYLIRINEAATRPSNPTRAGYTFVNWYSEASLTTVYDFSLPVTESITLYAKWAAVVTPPNGNNNGQTNNNSGSTGSGTVWLPILTPNVPAIVNAPAVLPKSPEEPTLSLSDLIKNPAGITGTMTYVRNKTDDQGILKIEVKETALQELFSKLAESESNLSQPVAEIKVVTLLKEVRKIEVELENKIFQKVAENDAAAIKISTDIGSLQFERGAIRTISSALSKDAPALRVNIAHADPLRMSEKAKKTIGERPAYEFGIKLGVTEIKTFEGKIKASVPYVLKTGEIPSGIVVYYVNEQGLRELMEGRYNPITKTVDFTTSHFSTFLIDYFEASFKDVKKTAGNYQVLNYLAARDIISGSGGQFRPKNLITRADYLVMLMKAYGVKSDLKSKVNFKDAGKNLYYTGYLAKARAMDIIDVPADNRFKPTNKITLKDLYNMTFYMQKAFNEVFEDVEFESYLKEHLGSKKPDTTVTREEAAKVIYDLLTK